MEKNVKFLNKQHTIIICILMSVRECDKSWENTIYVLEVSAIYYIIGILYRKCTVLLHFNC